MSDLLKRLRAASETGVTPELIDDLIERIEKLETIICGIKTHANSGTSLSWRMQRIKGVLEKLEDK